MGEDRVKSALWVVIIWQAFAAYFALFFQSLIVWHAKTYNPLELLGYARTYGFPLKTFIVLEAVLLFIVVFFMHSHEKEKATDDVMGRGFRISPERQSYGDSHFETPKEYEKAAVVQSPENAYGTILGQLHQSGEKLINRRMDSENRLNSHIALVGASGTGKTFTFTKNFIFQAVKRRESIVLTDPDGGLFRDTAGYMEDNGYVVRRLDLNNLLLSDGWDAMRSIKEESAELDSQFFAQVVIANVSDDLTSIYATGPLSLLKSIVLRVVLGNDFAPEEKNLETVYNLLQNTGGEVFLDALFFGADTIDERVREKLGPEISQSIDDALDGKTSAMKADAEAALGPYMAFKQGSPNLRGNLVTNLAVQLQVLQSQIVRKVLSTNDIDLELPGKTPCAYYCIFPDSHDTYRFIVSLFFSMLMTRLVSFADAQPETEYHAAGELPVPVNFLLDEFPSIGILPDWDRKMSTIRKRRINATMIFQDITQLQNLYPKTWVTILSNCSTFISLGINDKDTSKMVTDRIGNTTIEAKTDQRTNEMSRNFFRAMGIDPGRTSVGEGRRSLLSLDELFKIDEDRLLIILQGHNPILAYKYPHTLHPEAKKLRKIYVDSIPSFSDKEARAKRAKEERERLKAYYEKHPPAYTLDRSYKGLCKSDSELSLFTKIKQKTEAQLQDWNEEVEVAHPGEKMNWSSVKEKVKAKMNPEEEKELAHFDLNDNSMTMILRPHDIPTTSPKGLAGKTSAKADHILDLLDESKRGIGENTVSKPQKAFSKPKDEEPFVTDLQPSHLPSMEEKEIVSKKTERPKEEKRRTGPAPKHSFNFADGERPPKGVRTINKPKAKASKSPFKGKGGS